MLRKTILIIFLVGIATLLYGAFGLLSEWPGGARPSYEARDDDPRLTAIAAGALPIIEALEGYHAEHKAYPAGDEVDLSALATEIGNSIPMHPSAGATAPGDLWSYSRGRGGSSYSLSKKLGWDTALTFRRDALDAQWVFVRGDGTDDVTVILHPSPQSASR
ncbi:MAG: hypothetical protein ACHQAY_09890 [Hyphomicrobiales bacterium]